MRYWVVVALGLGLATAAHAADSIHYTLSPQIDGDALTALDVTMTFFADDDGETELDLPDHWGGGKDLYTRLTDVRIDGAAAVASPRPAVRIITSAPGAALTVLYRLPATLKAGEEAPVDTDYRYPVIGPQRFYVLGPTIFARLDGRDADKVAFTWTGAPGWTFASDLEYLPDTATPEDISQSVLIGGTDVHIDHVRTPHTDLRIATAGAFDFPLPDYDDKVVRTIAAEQAFWNDGQDHFLVTLAPVRREADNMGVHGSGFGDAFAQITSPDIPEDYLAANIAHEYFHSWNIQKLGGPDGGDREAEGYWFSEGFTDYYARKLALRAGVIDLKQFADSWNKALNEQALSPVRNAPNARITVDFWNDPDVEKLPYNRGAMLAAYWNAAWRTEGVTVDRFMIALRDAVQAHPDMARLPVSQRVATEAATLDVPVADDIAHYVVDGQDVILPQDTFGGCLKVITEQAPVFALGYDMDATRDAGAITGVDPNSNAYRAGLRDGMVRQAVLSGEMGDSSVPVSFRLRTADGTEQVITWLPQGTATYMRQRIIVPELDADALKACTAAVAAN
jgi:predicted metalloprotease with PDZ domain